MRAIAIAVVLSIFSTSGQQRRTSCRSREGNQWTYTMSNGVQITTKITGFADVGSGPRARLPRRPWADRPAGSTSPSMPKGVKTYMGQAQDQEFRYDPPVLRIKLPYQEGDTWTADGQPVRHVRDDELPVDRQGADPDTGGHVRLHQGLFDRQRLPGQPPTVSISYYADGIGPVRQMMQAGGQEMTATLASRTSSRTEAADAGRIPPPKSAVPSAAPRSTPARSLSPVRPEHDRALSRPPSRTAPQLPPGSGRHVSWRSTSLPTARSCSTSRRAGK